jgi:hypothetical protein
MNYALAPFAVVLHVAGGKSSTAIAHVMNLAASKPIKPVCTVANLTNPIAVAAVGNLEGLAFRWGPFIIVGCIAALALGLSLTRHRQTLTGGALRTFGFLILLTIAWGLVGTFIGSNGC